MSLLHLHTAISYQGRKALFLYEGSMIVVPIGKNLLLIAAKSISRPKNKHGFWKYFNDSENSDTSSFLYSSNISLNSSELENDDNLVYSQYMIKGHTNSIELIEVI